MTSNTTRGHHVSAVNAAGDGEALGDNMAIHTADLNGQFAESAKLEAAIKANLGGMGYGE